MAKKQTNNCTKCVCGEEGDSKTKKKKGHYSKYIVGEVQKHYKVPTLESIKKHAMETYWVMENVNPRIHNQGKWQSASHPDRCTTKKRDASTSGQDNGWART